MEISANTQQFEDLILLFLRIALGAIFLTHGTQKLAMWKMQPSPQMSSSFLLIIKGLSAVEPVAGVAVLAGIFTKPAALILAIVMLGAMWFKITKWRKQFSQEGGWELDFLLFTVALSLLLMGGGDYSLENILTLARKL